jgi:hypothetical protein
VGNRNYIRSHRCIVLNPGTGTHADTGTDDGIVPDDAAVFKNNTPVSFGGRAGNDGLVQKPGMRTDHDMAADPG